MRRSARIACRRPRNASRRSVPPHPGGICSWEKERLVSRDRNALSSLFLPDDSQDDLFRKTEEGWGPMSEEIDIRELKDEVNLLVRLAGATRASSTQVS